MKKDGAKLWFLLGLCSQLQIVASLSISEVVILLVSPFLFLKNYHNMKKDGVLTYFNLSLLLVLGTIVSILYNHTDSYFAIRGLATVWIISSSIIVSHCLLRKDLTGFKWYLLGYALSGIICIFVFQKSVEISAHASNTGNVAASDIMSGPIFWITRLSPFVLLLTKGWYLYTPIIFDICATTFLASFALLTTVSGRSSALGAIGFIVLLLIGGKTQQTMQRIGKKFILFMFLGVLFLFAVKNGYSYMAVNGILGEEAQTKYEQQTKGGEGILALLMGGRMEVFCGLFACIDQPIIGMGPWAEDRNGYVEDYMAKYGTQEDFERFLRIKADHYSFRLIPAHSQIVGFWLWYGIAGLIFMLYSLFVIIRYIKKDCWVVPQWYGWIVCASPAILWDMFFSPFQDRIMFPMIITACLMARAIHRGSLEMPFYLIEEIGEQVKKRG